MKTKSPSQPAHGPYIATRRPLSRRHFLRAAGVALSLPMLDAMLPALARAQPSSSPLAPGAKPRRMFAVINNLGFVPANFFPKGAGRDYAPSPYLDLLKEHRNDLTVFTGVSLPNVSNSHSTEVCFITGAPGSGGGSFRNTISLDQIVAESIGTQTRFPSLALAINTNTLSLSFTGNGVAIPGELRAAEVFKQLFVQGNPAEVEAQVRRLAVGRSILDALAGQVKDMQRELGAPDRERVEQYLESVRALESRLQVSQGWERRPKPVVTAPTPVDATNPAQFIEKIRVMFDLARLVFETDSTRAITLFIDAATTPVVESKLDVQITEGYHGLSHHGKSEDKLNQLKALDVAQFKLLNKLLAEMKGVKEQGESLLDRTMVLFGSNFFDANSHLTKNMPIILAGGGFRHGQHLVFDTESNYPLTNLHLTMLQRFGIEKDRFSSSTGTMRGLQMT
ncbi:MAG: DUF1552 domain-containing protein [Opitutus sp.]|nr:DUF1552 domain-containing protein [Opitutus sp.]